MIWVILANYHKIVGKEAVKLENKKVVVIGGGPAGMIAAGTAAGRGLNVTLIEKKW